jgi:hypothetical protein
MSDDLEIPAFLDRRTKKSETPPGEIPISQISDAGAQMRVEMHQDTIADYADDMLDGTVFPPVILFHDGTNYWLADGYHRLEAAKKLERKTIVAEIREGTKRDAILFGIGANAAHGLRRTQADKRRAVEKLLSDPEWSSLSDRQLAKMARVDHKTVGAIRRELIGEIPTRPKSGEIPSIKSPAKTQPTASVVEDLLKTISDEALMAECQRRGLVGGDD